MWTIIIIIWFLIGIGTAIAVVFDYIKKKLSISLKDLFSIIGWILIGPILWLTFVLLYLSDWIENHQNDDIIKFKNNKFK